MLRRDFFLGVTLIAASFPSMPAYAQDTADIELLDDLPPLPVDLQQYANEKPAQYLELAAVGTGKPSTREIGTAYDILVSSPFNCTPLDVAMHFYNLGKGTLGADKRGFAREWPRTANPLIFHFFSATGTKPEGDTTAWCAAFMNWCIMRSHAKSSDEIGKSPGTYSRSGKPLEVSNFELYATRSASSGSFRCWKAITNPSPGDIVVLADKGTQGLTALCLGKGHVTMFLKKTDRKDWIEVLGGNQTQEGSNGAVTRANQFIGSGSRFLKYVSATKKLES
jgi:hypothetical protein